MAKLVSLLPHPIVLALPSGERQTIAPSGAVARCAPPAAVLGDEGLPVPVARQGALGPVVGLPAPEDGVVFVVSGLVLGHPSLAGRRDVVAPGTGPADGAVREGGQVVAVTRLVGRAD